MTMAFLLSSRGAPQGDGTMTRSSNSFGRRILSPYERSNSAETMGSSSSLSSSSSTSCQSAQRLVENILDDFGSASGMHVLVNKRGLYCFMYGGLIMHVELLKRQVMISSVVHTLQNAETRDAILTRAMEFNNTKGNDLQLGGAEIGITDQGLVLCRSANFHCLLSTTTDCYRRPEEFFQSMLDDFCEVAVQIKRECKKIEKPTRKWLRLTRKRLS